ncbi:MAG: hypothetical protein ACRC8S_14070 [Fimbriiglobus sp.]
MIPMALFTAFFATQGQPSYVYVPAFHRTVGIALPTGAIAYGKLDASGEFVFSHRLPDSDPPGDFAICGSGPSWMQPRFLRWGAAEPYKAYELRSGMLIPGTIETSGRFVPTSGAKIISFADYKYSPEAPKIWNLPGDFQLLFPGQSPPVPQELSAQPSWVTGPPASDRYRIPKR